MTKKPRKRLPFVGDGEPSDVPGVLPQPAEAFKTLDHPCSVCGEANAPFGVDYPINPKWFCRQHSGAVMPEVDQERFDTIRHDAMLIANQWLAVAIAGERRDKVSAWTACRNIQQLNKKLFPLIKALGTGGEADG